VGEEVPTAASVGGLALLERLELLGDEAGSLRGGGVFGVGHDRFLLGVFLGGWEV
jgi:hypothetical protein